MLSITYENNEGYTEIKQRDKDCLLQFSDGEKEDHHSCKYSLQLIFFPCKVVESCRRKDKETFSVI